MSLSWRVQNIVVIGRAYSKLECSEFSSNFEFDRNMLSGTGAWPELGHTWKQSFRKLRIRSIKYTDCHFTVAKLSLYIWKKSPVIDDLRHNDVLSMSQFSLMHVTVACKKLHIYKNTHTHTIPMVYHFDIFFKSRLVEKTCCQNNNKLVLLLFICSKLFWLW